MTISLCVLCLVLGCFWVTKDHLYYFKTCFNICQSASKMPFSLGLICLHKKILVIFCIISFSPYTSLEILSVTFFFSDLQISSLAILNLLNLNNAFLPLDKQIFFF